MNKSKESQKNNIPEKSAQKRTHKEIAEKTENSIDYWGMFSSRNYDITKTNSVNICKNNLVCYIKKNLNCHRYSRDSLA